MKNLELFRKNIKWVLVLLALIGIGQYSSASDYYLMGIRNWNFEDGNKMVYKTTNTYLIRFDNLQANTNYKFKVVEAVGYENNVYWGKKSDWGDVECSTTDYGGLISGNDGQDINFRCSEGGNYFFQYYIDNNKITIWKANPAGGFDNGDNKGVSLSVYKNGSPSGIAIYKHGSAEWGQGNQFGAVRTFFIGDASAYYYQTAGDFGCEGYYNLCDCKLIWQVRDMANDQIKKNSDYNLSKGDPSWADCNGHGSYANGDMGVDIEKDLAPGNYHLEWWFKMQGGPGDGNCSTDKYYKYDNNNNFWVGFTAPGFKASNYIFGTKTRGDASITHTYGFNSYGWTPAYVEILSGGSSAITFNDGTIAKKSVTIKDDYGSTTLKFDPSKGNIGLNTVTLRLSGTLDGQTYTKDVTISGEITSDMPTVVYIADTAHIAAGPEVTLQGYVKFTGCVDNINRYGFKIGDDCEHLNMDAYTELTEPMKQSALFTKTVNQNLVANHTYFYKAYVKSPTIDTPFISEECGTFTTREGCIYPAGDTIYYTIDSSADESDCSLVFNTIEDALSNLKTKHNNSAVTSEYWWNPNTSMLVKNIVFSIVPNKAGYGVSGERVDLSNINKFDESKGTNPKPDKEFILRSAISGTKPLVYGLNLENSRKVTLDGILVRRVVSSGTGMGTACILVGLNKETNDLTVGKMTDAMLTIKNCAIDATAFCCIHGQGIDGLYMENNDLIAACPGNDSNANNWGASMKFMNSKNIVLLRNNFKGAHSNNIFAQNVRNVLIMNNVFWNDNKQFTTEGGDNNSAIIRLINYGADNVGHKVQNIGMYYNTMYLADNDNNKSVNFLTLGGKASGSPAQSKDATYYDFNTIDFKYNNCYSYDKDVPGKTSDAFCGVDISKSTHITTNNFWAAKSGADFSFGSETKNVDMSLSGGIVCETASNTPEGLVIKGSGLNLGAHLESDVAGVNISGATYPAKDIYSDRRNTEIRPKSISPWTLGAFQQSMGGTVHQIIWNGDLNDNWDNRNNWVKMVGTQAVLVTCVDDLAEDLEVIIPEPYSTKYPRLKSDHISRYPVIPVWSEPSNAEQVRAGLTSATIGTVSEFANKISIEYGGTIKGVENLGAAEHYTGTEGQLTTDRKEWVLVGTVVKPFVEGESGAVRNIKSRDFYIENHMPHVYMNQIGESGGGINFGVPFTSLDEEVSANTAFAIQVADQYGAYKLPASVYFLREEPDPSRVGEGTMPHTYQFVGRFANDEALPTLSLELGYNFLNNSYPSVLDASKLATALGNDYDIKLYSYTDGAWDDYKNVPEYDQKIKPQSGFVINASVAKEQALDQEMYDGSYSGKYKSTLKSVDAESGLVLRAYNTVNNKGSNVGIWYDYKDIEKAFNTSVTDNAELYILKGDGKYSTVTMADVSAVIPLGIRNKSTAPFTVKFEITNSEGIESAVLEDRGVEPVAYYDLLDESTNAFFQHIMPGDLEGRFFLNLNYADDDDIPTDDDDVTTSNADIDLYGDGNSIIISSSENVMLKSAEITDMSGRKTIVTLKNAHYNKIKVNGAQGVYVVKAIGDTKTETAKVIVK